MAETVREMVVRLTMDAGGFKKTAAEINNQIKNIDKEIKAMGGDPAKSKLEEKLGLQIKAVENLQKAVEDARKKLNDADTDAKKLLAAKQLSGLETQLNTAATQAERLKNQLDAANYIKWGGLVTNFGSAMQRMGRSFSMYVGAPLAALGGKAYKDALQYETVMADLGIATETTGEELEAVNQQVLAMSETIPMSYKELAALTATLARAGVPAEELERVTRVLAGLGATTDVSAEQSAAAMIKFMNVMGIPLSQVEQFASTLVALGNAGVSTGSEIFEMAQRMSATGNLAGLSGVEVLGLASAFASLGINAEAGGTSASKLMKAMQLAAETGKGLNDEVKKSGEVVMGFTTAMGMTEEQFKESWGRDQVGTMLAFFDALKGSADTGGDSVLAMLDAMEMTEVRLSNLIGVGASNPDFFREMLGLGRDAWVDNTALAKGVEVAYGTAQAAQDIALNKMENASADVGENIVDIVQPIIEKVSELVGEFSKLDEETQTRWIKIAGALVLLGPAAIGIGNVAKGVGTLIGWIGKVKAGDATTFTKLLGALAGPAGGWLLAAGGIAAVVIALNNIKTPSEEIIDGLKNIVIDLDEDSYNATMAALAEVKAQVDALSGETGEQNKNISTAVKRGYGTDDMYGTALGYEAMLTQSQIAEIAGRYSDKYDELNAAIGAAKTDADAKRAAEERNTLKANWDAEVAQAKANYMAQVSALVSGMMQGQPEAKAALEQAAKDYDLLAALENATSQVMATDDQAAIDALWASFFTPDIMNKYFEGQRFEDIIPATAVDLLRQELITSLKTSLEKAGGEDSLAYTLLQSILTDPLAAGLYDATLTQGALDGLVELLDFKSAGEQAGMDFGEGLTPGLADAITGSIPDVSGAMNVMQGQLVGQAAAMASAISAAFAANLNFSLPGVGGVPGGGSVINSNVTLNGPANANSIYKIQRGLTDAARRAARGYGKG